MVVALDADRRGDAVTHVDDTGILSRPDQHPRGFGWQAFEMDPARLVGAVLRPHHGEHGQFEVIRRAPENALDLERLVVGQTESSMHIHPSTLANAMGILA